MSHKSLPAIATCLVLAVSAVSCGSNPEKGTGSFENPVIRRNCADPTILDNRSRDGWIYAYSTQDGDTASDTVRFLPVYRSKDLVNWEPAGDGFSAGRPQWQPRARNWAPDMNYINGKYVVYYALGVWGRGDLSASGVAVSDSPTGPFKDIGMIVDSTSTGVSNSIDPNYFEDNGHKYLYWGSLGRPEAGDRGIFVVELSDDGLSVKEGSKPVKLAGNFMEGAYVHRHGDWIYLFASEGTCCVQEKSTYHVIVGRSKSPLGPFVSKSGMSMITGVRDVYDQVLMKGDEALEFPGPGHNAEIFTDDAGVDWMPMHVYWKGNGYRGRCMALEPVFWDEEGWPYFASGTIRSRVDMVPVIK